MAFVDPDEDVVSVPPVIPDQPLDEVLDEAEVIESNDDTDDLDMETVSDSDLYWKTIMKSEFLGLEI